MKKIFWCLKEMVKMYSANDVSYFSKKRFESGIAFVILQWGMIHYLILRLLKSDFAMTDMVLWAGVEATICGYMMNQIQKEKINNNETSDSDNTIK